MWTNVQINQIVSKQDLVKHSGDEDGVGRRDSVRCQEILMNGCGNIRHVTASVFVLLFSRKWIRK